MERFVALIVGGGLALLAGLWVATVAAPRSAPWLAGVVASVAGTAALGAGIADEVEV